MRTEHPAALPSPRFVAPAAPPRFSSAGSAAGVLLLERVLIRKKRRWLVVKLEEVDWIEGARNYVRIHVGGATHLLRRTLAALEPRLDCRRFVRIHRSAIVNLDRVVELRDTRSGRYDVLLADGTRLSLSRSRRCVLDELTGRR